MDLLFVESLLLVVETGSIAQAARGQHLTAAAIRQRVSAIERELSADLLSRSGHTCLPTQACIRLLPRFKNLVREAELLREETDTTGLSGALKIGAISTALTGFIPSALHGLAKHAPNIKPYLKPGTSAALYEAVLSGELDGVITVAPPFSTPKTVTIKRLSREPLVLISKRKLNVSIKQQLSNSPYIRYDAASWGGLIAQQYISDQRIQPRLLCELDGLEAITMMVAENLGVSLVPEWKGLNDFHSRVYVTPIAGSKYHRDIVLITRRIATQSEKMKLFSSLIMPK
jgi:DNA-binding transcriptional LysR family regulator